VFLGDFLQQSPGEYRAILQSRFQQWKKVTGVKQVG